MQSLVGDDSATVPDVRRISGEERFGAGHLDSKGGLRLIARVLGRPEFPTETGAIRIDTEGIVQGLAAKIEHRFACRDSRLRSLDSELVLPLGNAHPQPSARHFNRPIRLELHFGLLVQCNRNGIFIGIVDQYYQNAVSSGTSEAGGTAEIDLDCRESAF